MSSDMTYQTGQGASALDQQQEQDRLDGYAVVSGYGVSTGTGLEVEVASGEAIFGTDGSGNPVLVSNGSTQTVSLSSADSTNPRKDVIFVQGDGTVNKQTGVARTAKPSDQTRFSTFQPEPPSMHDVEGVVLAEVWVAAEATSLASGDIRDRRQSATATHEKMVVDELNAQRLGGPLDANTNDITNVGSLDTELLATKNIQWETVNRTFGSWETAPTDRDIWAAVTLSASADATDVNVVFDVDNAESSNAVTQPRLTLETNERLEIGPVKIPSGQTYRLSAFGDSADYAIESWKELR